jgi:hypothetical protein
MSDDLSELRDDDNRVTDCVRTGRLVDLLLWCSEGQDSDELGTEQAAAKILSLQELFATDLARVLQEANQRLATHHRSCQEAEQQRRAADDRAADQRAALLKRLAVSAPAQAAKRARPELSSESARDVSELLRVDELLRPNGVVLPKVTPPPPNSEPAPESALQTPAPAQLVPIHNSPCVAYLPANHQPLLPVQQ